MNISMWMLAEHLPQYSPEPHITEGTMCIRNASMLFSGESVSTHTVYVSCSDAFIPTTKGQIVCMNRNDYIILNSEDVEEVLESIVRIIDEYLEWDLCVREMMYKGCSLDDVMERDATVLKHLLFIVNSGFLYTSLAGKEYLSYSYAYWNLLRIGDGMPMDHVREYVSFIGRHRSNRQPIFYTDSLESSSGWLQALYYGDSLQGYFMLFLEGTHHYTHTDRQLFDVCMEHLTIWYQLNPPQRSGNEYADLAAGLLTGKELPLSVEDRQIWQRIGWAEKDSKQVAVIRMDDFRESEAYRTKLPNDGKKESRTEYEKNRRSSSSESGVLLFRIRHYLNNLFPFGIMIAADTAEAGEYHVLLNLTRAESLPAWEDFCRLIRKEEIPVGLSCTFTSMDRGPEALEQARIAVEYAGRERGTPLDCQACALEYMDHFLKKRMPVDLSHPLVGKLQEHDRLHHSNLEETARVWLLKERSLVRTSKALNIHINTLKYRLKQLRELGLPEEISDYERVHLLLSLMAAGSAVKAEGGKE